MKIMKKKYINPLVDVHEMTMESIICASLTLIDEDANNPGMGREELPFPLEQNFPFPFSL